MPKEGKLTLQHLCYSQLINKPTHITKESFSCNDLIFATSPHLIRGTGVELSIFEKCHHLIREVWDYKNPNVNHLQCAVSCIHWEFLFRGANVNKKFDILNECLKNIFLYFIPNRIIKCNY